ncbi:FAD-binding oxidoreductase OS=Streptomyces microflavus OX=1919 GN=G3I39_35140 PE=3 SV=1 [Streptomyces microflavus]
MNGRGIPAGRNAVIPTVTPEDARYPDMIRGHGNNRHVASPEAIRIPSTTEQVVEIVKEAVRDGKRIALRSGGHCFANLVFNDESEIIVDLRLMDHVGFDDEREAFVVEPGATLLQIYELLHIGWGVTLPGGCYATGAGGHFSGAGTASSPARTASSAITSTPSRSSPWTSGVRCGRSSPPATRTTPTTTWPGPWREAAGAASVVVTRFWMRSRGAEGGPGDLLPKAPSTVLCTFAAWSWGDITREGFASFMSAYADWSKEHGSLDSPYLSLGHWLFLQHAETGMFGM